MGSFGPKIGCFPSAGATASLICNVEIKVRDQINSLSGEMDALPVAPASESEAEGQGRNLLLAALVFFVLATLYGTLVVAIKEDAGLDDFLESMLVAGVFSPAVWILLLLPLGLLASWKQSFGKSYFTIPFGIAVGSLISIYWDRGGRPIELNDAFELKWLLFGPVCCSATGAFVSYCRERRTPMESIRIFHSMIVATVGALISSLACEIVTAIHPLPHWNYWYILFVALWIALSVWMLILLPISLFLQPGASLWNYRFSVPIGFLGGGLFSVGMARYTPGFDLLQPWFRFQILHFPILGGITGAMCAAAFSWLEFRDRKNAPL